MSKGRYFRWIMLLLLVVIQASPTIKAEPIAPESFAAKKCSVDPPAEWTLQEKWVWKAACEGSEADLAKQYGGTDDPSKPGDWPAERTLRAGFLEAVLLTEPFRSAIGHKGLRLSGARFEGRLDFEGGRHKERGLDR